MITKEGIIINLTQHLILGEDGIKKQMVIGFICSVTQLKSTAVEVLEVGMVTETGEGVPVAEEESGTIEVGGTRGTIEETNRVIFMDNHPIMETDTLIRSIELEQEVADLSMGIEIMRLVFKTSLTSLLGQVIGIPLKNKQLLLILEISHMDEWQKHMLWPLSCYAYHKETPCLPGFSDISPEELRWEAYQAKTKNTSEQYLQQIRGLSDKHLKTLNMYARTTADDVENLRSGQLPSSPLFGSQGSAAGSDFFSPSNTGSTVSSLFGPSSSLQTTATLFGSSTQTQSLFQSNDQTLANIGTTIQAVTTVAPSSPSLFSSQQTAQSLSTSQQTPSQAQQQPLTPSTTHVVSAAASVETTKTDQQKLEAFKADKFILGHIPEHAPSKELC